MRVPARVAGPSRSTRNDGRGASAATPPITTSMRLVRLLRRTASRLLQSGSRRTTGPDPVPAVEAGSASLPPGFGFTGAPGEDSLRSMTAEALLAWENRNVPVVERTSDEAEAAADERQDATTSLNFPLHWTSATETWNYLFDMAVACELLAPRPDDLVLDLASGTGWATELLARIGVRTVSIDLSLEMMRRGRQRLAADARLLHRHDARFVAARGQALPFADGVFDAVLCMNALHHLPAYGDALREIHRVLKSGGRAVLSEPGTAHAAAALSQFRMREEGVLEKPVSLPLIHRLASDAGFTRMRVVPLRSAGAYTFDYHASERDDEPLRQMWNDTIRHSPTEHARCALHKGDDPPADTLLPADKLVRRLGAAIALVDVSASVGPGEPFIDTLRITNTGSVTWKARGRRFGGQVTCGLKICTTAGVVLREDLGRTPLPQDIAPGETIDVAMRIEGHLEPGQYELRYDMVVEGVTWFEFQGSPCPRRRLVVVP